MRKETKIIFYLPVPCHNDLTRAVSHNIKADILDLVYWIQSHNIIYTIGIYRLLYYYYLWRTNTIIIKQQLVNSTVKWKVW